MSLAAPAAAPGRFTTFDVPQSNQTFAYGVSSAGQVVGYYQDTAGQNRGFMTTVPVPEPPALAAACAGALARRAPARGVVGRLRVAAAAARVRSAIIPARVAMDLDRVRAHVRNSSTEGILDQATVYRGEIENGALEVIESELAARGIGRPQVEAHAALREQGALFRRPDGTVVRCNFRRRCPQTSPAPVGPHRRWTGCRRPASGSERRGAANRGR